MLAVVIVIMTMKMITRKLFHMHESRIGRLGVAVDNRTAASHFPRAGVDVLFFSVQEKPKQNQLTHHTMCTTLFSPVAYSFWRRNQYTEIKTSKCITLPEKPHRQNKKLFLALSFSKIRPSDNHKPTSELPFFSLIPL